MSKREEDNYGGDSEMHFFKKKKSLLDIVCWVSEKELALLAIEKSLPMSLLNRTQIQNARKQILVVGYTRTTCPAILLVWPKEHFTFDKSSDFPR